MSVIAVYDLVGKEIVSQNQFVSVGKHTFQLSGLSDGVYILQVRLPEKTFSAKLINSGNSNVPIQINYNGIVGILEEISVTKSATTEKYWQFNTGDRLKFTGTTEKYSTVVMDIPTSSKTLSFQFIECTDADGNNYPIVQIGTQIWMAENLKTTKYNDETAIPNITENTQWAGLTTGAFCWYNNDAVNYKNTYGALYNFYAVNTNKLAPRGWHVPTDEEWKQLEKTLDMTQAQADGEGWRGSDQGLQMKTTSGWNNNGNGNNAIGFSALPGGYRYAGNGSGEFYDIGNRGVWCSFFETSINDTWVRLIHGTKNEVLRTYDPKGCGFSVRCVLGSPAPNITIPSVTTSIVSNFTSSSAVTGGSITSDGNATITGRGVVYSTTQNPTISNIKTNDGSGTGSFISNLTGLEANTKYYVRAYATNSLGTAYGNEISFTTKQNITSPTVTTTAATDITQTTATSGGNVASDGGATVTARGVCWSTNQNPTTANSKTSDGTGTGSFTSNLSGLTANTTYYIRAYATNSIGTAYGSQYSFTTELMVSLGKVNTKAVTSYTNTTAIMGGNVTDDGNANVSECGIVYATTQNPTTANTKVSIGSGIGIFSTNVSGLTAGTTYCVRAYAINSQGITYGDQFIFTTSSSTGVPCPAMPNVTFEGQTYNTVQIGLQCWLKENLNVGKRININQNQINNGIIEKNCINNLEENCVVYGGLYQWAELVQYLNGTTNSTSWNPVPIESVQGICPTGWHIPSLSEWQTLGDFLGGPSVAGGKLKETGTVHWNDPNVGATNESGFTALPGSYLLNLNDNGLGRFGKSGAFSTSTLLNSLTRYTFLIRNQDSNFWQPTYLGDNAFSVRCLYGYGIPSITVTIDTITEINRTTATFEGNVSSNGGTTITAKGVCWGTIPNPTLTDNHSTDGTGVGIFKSVVTGLSEKTLYYVRAYATNEFGTTYGNELTFTTLFDPKIPAVTTSTTSNIYVNSATSGGNVISDGWSTVTAKGICWSTSVNPTIADSHTIDGTDTGGFASKMTGLSANTLYHYRAYATNSVGTSYGEDLTFTTQPIPSVRIGVSSPFFIQPNYHVFVQYIVSNGSSSISSGVDFSPYSANGISWEPTFDWPLGRNTGNGDFRYEVKSLISHTKYAFRAWVEYGDGIRYYSEVAKIETP